MNPKIVGLFAGLWMLVSFSSAHADYVVYSYTGNPFTTVSGPYTTSDYITGDLVLDNPMVAAPGSQIDASTLAGFSLTLNDKVQTFSNPALQADFALDGAGNIASWAVVLSTPGTGEIETNFGPISVVGNFDESIHDSGGLAYSAHNVNPGTWSETCYSSFGSPVSCPPYQPPVPEPATAWMMLLGLFSLGALVRCRQTA